MDAIETYIQSEKLLVQPHVVERAVRALSHCQYVVEALALIRGAYADDEGAFASLDDAKTIFTSIVHIRK